MIYLYLHIYSLKVLICKQLAQPSIIFYQHHRSDHTEQTWVWQTDSELFYFDKNETVRFRVENEHWNDQSPATPVAERDVDGALVVGERRSPYGIEVVSLFLHQICLGPHVG